MDIFEQKRVLKSFKVVIDTREQPTKRAEKRYQAFGAPFERATLDFGDYTYNATLPDGRPLYDTESRIVPACAIERKMDLDELAQCYTTSRKRFQAEFERAKAAGARIYLIVENGNMENLLNGRYRSRFNANAFVGSVTAYMVRYGAQLVFCKEETSGRLIREILYRDLKERLERGDFDEGMDKGIPKAKAE